MAGRQRPRFNCYRYLLTERGSTWGSQLSLVPSFRELFCSWHSWVFYGKQLARGHRREIRMHTHFAKHNGQTRINPDICGVLIDIFVAVTHSCRINRACWKLRMEACWNILGGEGFCRQKSCYGPTILWLKYLSHLT